MKTKIISLTTAAILTTHSFAFAGSASDRTAGITDEAVAEAQSNIQFIVAQLGGLDRSLADTEKAIMAREKSGRGFNGVAITGAALGLGLSALSALSLSHSHDGAGAIMASVFTIFSAAATGISAASGAGSVMRKSEVDLANVSRQLTGLRAQVSEEMIINGADSNRAGLLNLLKVSIGKTQEALSVYYKNKNDQSRNRVISEIAQATGVALTFFGLTQRDGSKYVQIGALIAGAGNIASIVAGFSGTQAEDVLKEIGLTRQSIQVAIASMK